MSPDRQSASGLAGLLHSLRERGALTLPLYLLVPDADTWLRADTDGHPPEVLCRLSPDGPVRFSMRPEGRVWFSARLGLDGQRHPTAGAEILSLAVRGAGRRRTWSIPVVAPRGPRSRGRTEQEWRIFLGRFRGEPIEVALEMERADPGRVVVLDNPALHLVASLPALLARAARRSWHTLRRDGLPGVLAEIAAVIDAERGRDLRYRYWIRRHGARDPSEASGPPPAALSIAERAASTSVLVRVGIETSWAAVASLLDSVAGQRARPCEVVAIADDATARDVRAALRARAEREPSLRLIEGGGDASPA